MTGAPQYRRRLAALLAAVCGVLPLFACTSERNDSSPRPVQASPSPSDDPCPARYVEPDPERPRVTLRFSLDAARRTVTGTETVVFTPDLPVRELVFRLWANQASAPAGTRLTVTAARSGSASRFAVERAGAAPGKPGTLLRLPLGRQVPAGEAVAATVDFTLAISADPVFERWGSSGKTAWWGTGHPLLAWERGAGWQTQPAGPVFGEYAVSETARYDVTVDAPAADTVLITGIADAPVQLGPGRRRWHAMNLTARDISVAVGQFQLRETEVDGVPVRAAVSSDTAADPGALLSLTSTAMRRLATLLGPFPYPGMTVVALPSFGRRGIEYPGGFFAGPILDPVTITHEVAHGWFYGLVGDNQARDPWLDEAFATYAEAVVAEKPDAYRNALNQPEPVGGATASYAGANPRLYSDVVYGKGAAALLAARAKAGAPAFDAALRCYVNANAWRIATPADLAEALEPLPAAREVLRAAGALT